MKVTINAQLVVESGSNHRAVLLEAACKYLDSKGFKTAMPLTYPQDPIIIEIPEPLPEIKL